jgi:hypothetical protein
MALWLLISECRFVIVCSTARLNHKNRCLAVMQLFRVFRGLQA